MWKFRSSERLDKLETAVERLTNAQEQLRTLPKKLELEWEDTLDKLGRIMSRLNQRARREEPNEPESHEVDPNNTKHPPQPSDHDTLKHMRSRVFGGR